MYNNDTIVELCRRIVLQSKVMEDVQPKIVVRCDLTHAEIHMQRVKADECKVVLVRPESRWEEYFTVKKKDTLNKWQMDRINAHLFQANLNKCRTAIFLDNQRIFYSKYQQWTDDVYSCVEKALEICQQSEFHIKHSLRK